MRARVRVALKADERSEEYVEHADDGGETEDVDQAFTPTTLR
jgi:hypothetical protein